MGASPNLLNSAGCRNCWEIDTRGACARSFTIRSSFRREGRGVLLFN